MAAAGRDRVLCLPRSAYECAGARGVPTPRLGSLEAHALSAQPEIPYDVGPNGKTCQRLAPPRSHPASLAGATLYRQTPKVGAECLNRARSDLCGGRPAMGVPTANASRLSVWGISPTANDGKFRSAAAIYGRSP